MENTPCSERFFPHYKLNKFGPHTCTLIYASRPLCLHGFLLKLVQESALLVSVSRIRAYYLNTPCVVTPYYIPCQSSGYGQHSLEDLKTAFLQTALS